MNESDRLVLVRHGETEWSREHRHTGRTDLPLTAHGLEQAAALRPVLGAYHFAAVFVSPLQRARETCAQAGLSDRAVVDADLAEWDYGECDGLTLAQIRERWPGWDLWRDGPPGGETIAQVAARVERVIARCRGFDGDVLLIAHGHALRVLTARWLELPPAAGRRFALEPASPCVLGFEHEWTVMHSWNLPADGGAALSG